MQYHQVSYSSKTNVCSIFSKASQCSVIGYLPKQSKTTPKSTKTTIAMDPKLQLENLRLLHSVYREPMQLHQVSLLIILFSYPLTLLLSYALGVLISWVFVRLLCYCFSCVIFDSIALYSENELLMKNCKLFSWQCL